MLKGSLKSGSFSSLDEYEELLEVVDGLSYRQFVALRRLSEYENEFSNVSAEKDKHHMELYWDKYRSEITNTLGIAEADFESFMTRLESSGLYARQIGGWGANPSLGNTTGVFRKLIDLVEGD